MDAHEDTPRVQLLSVFDTGNKRCSDHTAPEVYICAPLKQGGLPEDYPHLSLGLMKWSKASSTGSSSISATGEAFWSRSSDMPNSY